MSSSTIEEYEARLSKIALDGCLTLSISLGTRLGLFTALNKIADDQSKAVTSEEFAQAGNLKERYVREWLNGMAVSDIISFVREDGTLKYYMSKERLDPLVGRRFLFEVVSGCGRYQYKTMECLPLDGPGGTSIVDYPDVHTAIGRKMNFWSLPGAIQKLTDEMGLTGRLEKGGMSVVDLGCGSAQALTEMARIFPLTKFYAVEIADELLNKARQKCKDLSNVEFVVSNACDLPSDWSGKYDLVMMFDVLHDCYDPKKLLSEVARICKQDGGFLLNDIDMPAALEEQIPNKNGMMADLAYMASLHYCLPTSLSDGQGAGLGTCVGIDTLIKMTETYGFSGHKRVAPTCGCNIYSMKTVAQ